MLSSPVLLSTILAFSLILISLIQPMYAFKSNKVANISKMLFKLVLRLRVKVF